MKVDRSGCGLEDELERSGALAAIASRFKAIEQRFPSASKGFLSIVDQAIFSGTSFLSAAIIGRMTATDDLGLYYLTLSMALFAATIQESVVWSPYIVYCKRRRGADLAEYSGSVWIFSLLFTAMTFVGLLVVVAALSVTNQSSIAPGLWALLGAAPLVMLRHAARRFAFSNLNVTSAIALDAVVAVTQLGGLVLIGVFGHLSLANIFAVMSGACGLACLGAYLLDPPALRFVRHRFVPDWCLNWAFAKWVLRSYLVGNTTPVVMLWILGLTVSASAAGVFGACSTLVGMTNVLVMGIDNVLTPQASHAFASGSTKDLRRILSRTAAFLVITLGGFCLFVLVTGDWLMVLVFGADYHGTAAILFALCLGTVMNSISTVAGGGLWVIDRPRSNFLADASCMGVTLILAAFLIVPWGVLGAALAILGGTVAAAVVRSMTLAHFLDGADRSSLLPASSQLAP